MNSHHQRLSILVSTQGFARLPQPAIANYSIARFEMCLKSKPQAGIGRGGYQNGHLNGHDSPWRIVDLF